MILFVRTNRVVSIICNSEEKTLFLQVLDDLLFFEPGNTLNPALLEAVPLSQTLFCYLGEGFFSNRPLSLCNYRSPVTDLHSHYRPGLYTRWKCWLCCSPRYERRITYVLALTWNDFLQTTGDFQFESHLQGIKTWKWAGSEMLFTQTLLLMISCNYWGGSISNKVMFNHLKWSNSLVHYFVCREEAAVWSIFECQC